MAVGIDALGHHKFNEKVFERIGLNMPLTTAKGLADLSNIKEYIRKDQKRPDCKRRRKAAQTK